LEKHYDVDSGPLLAEAGIDPKMLDMSGGRLPRPDMLKLWELSVNATGDRSLGLVVGSHIRPTTTYALGMAFMTCQTLAESLALICRYYRIVTTIPDVLEMSETDKDCRLTVISGAPSEYISVRRVAFDCLLSSLITMCRTSTVPEFAPLAVNLIFDDDGRAADYQAVFQAPVKFNAGETVLVFDRETLNDPLPGRSADLFDASDRILQEYAASLNPNSVSTEVRQIVLHLLPTGTASQAVVAARMNMSRSTLHRRLQQENSSYMDILDDTRQALAIEYVKDRKYSLSYIAFLLGFSDQSNFSRAFRRWTGKPPNTYRKPLEANQN